MTPTDDAPPRGTALQPIALLRFELFVRDPERSARFYEEALGFVVRTTSRGAGSDYTELVNGAVCIGIGRLASLSENHHFGGRAGGRRGVGVEIVFEVQDIIEYERRARAADAVFERLQRRPWGRRDFRVLDPDGYYVRVTEAPLGGRPRDSEI